MPVRWIAGLFFSLGVGWAVVGGVLWLLHHLVGVGDKRSLSPQSEEEGVPPWFTGIVERLFFTVLIGFNTQGVPAAMIGWIALKFATNWNHPDWKDKPFRRTYAFAALLAGLVSMLFAFLGGSICSGQWDIGL